MTILPPFDAPPPLRTDGSNEFAHISMRVRVPRIARDAVSYNSDYPRAIRDGIEELARAIEHDGPLPAPRPPGLDVEDWARDHEQHPSESWLDAQWFYAELSFYRELARECRFAETGRDPFASAKAEELAGERPWDRLGVALSRRGPRDQRLFALLDDALWGNRVDLSYAVAAGRAREDDDLIADEREQAVSRLVLPGASVHVVADNTGAELAIDLAVADAVLEDPSATVQLHVKTQPVFVSDAMAVDVFHLIDRMRSRHQDARRLADRLLAAFDARRLSLAPDPFWSGPRFLWGAPAHVHAALRSASLVVLKGDANYRRLIGDALWTPTTPFCSACGYLRAAIVCLRTMKSDPIVGLAPGLAERLDGGEPRWRVDGRRGVIQTYLPP